MSTSSRRSARIPPHVAKKMKEIEFLLPEGCDKNLVQEMFEKEGLSVEEVTNRLLDSTTLENHASQASSSQGSTDQSLGKAEHRSPSASLKSPSTRASSRLRASQSKSQGTESPISLISESDATPPHKANKRRKNDQLKTRERTPRRSTRTTPGKSGSGKKEKMAQTKKRKTPTSSRRRKSPVLVPDTPPPLEKATPPRELKSYVSSATMTDEMDSIDVGVGDSKHLYHPDDPTDDDVVYFHQYSRSAVGQWIVMVPTLAVQASPGQGGESKLGQVTTLKAGTVVSGMEKRVIDNETWLLHELGGWSRVLIYNNDEQSHFPALQPMTKVMNSNDDMIDEDNMMVDSQDNIDDVVNNLKRNRAASRPQSPAAATKTQVSSSKAVNATKQVTKVSTVADVIEEPTDLVTLVEHYFKTHCCEPVTATAVCTALPGSPSLVEVQTALNELCKMSVISCQTFALRKGSNKLRLSWQIPLGPLDSTPFRDVDDTSSSTIPVATPAQPVRRADTVSLGFSSGLGTPLTSSKADMAKAEALFRKFNKDFAPPTPLRTSASSLRNPSGGAMTPGFNKGLSSSMMSTPRVKASTNHLGGGLSASMQQRLKLKKRRLNNQTPLVPAQSSLSSSSSQLLTPAQMQKMEANRLSALQRQSNKKKKGAFTSTNTSTALETELAQLAAAGKSHKQAQSEKRGQGNTPRSSQSKSNLISSSPVPFSVSPTDMDEAVLRNAVMQQRRRLAEFQLKPPKETDVADTANVKRLKGKWHVAVQAMLHKLLEHGQSKDPRINMRMMLSMMGCAEHDVGYDAQTETFGEPQMDL